MKLFPVRGGVHPEYHKERTSESAIVALPMPAALYLPLQQHIGAPAEPVVEAGAFVKKGQLLARAGGAVSAPVHAPTSGRIASIAEMTAPHPSGLPQMTIILEPDGKDEWAELPLGLSDPFKADPSSIRQRVAEAGIVGMGGATFPSAVKLNLGTEKKLDILLLNGAECEPYLTCDDRVMREFAEEMIDGARIMAYALGAPKVVIAIEENKPQALSIVSEAAATQPNVEVVSVPAQYPMGSERHLVQAITGEETPARKLTADLGIVVHNVATARAVHHAVRFGRPLTSRVVTVSGGAIAKPQNVEVAAGGFGLGPDRVLRRPVGSAPACRQWWADDGPAAAVPGGAGGQGHVRHPGLDRGRSQRAAGPALHSLRHLRHHLPLRLGAGGNVGLHPQGKPGCGGRLGVRDCVSCGSCSYICPAHIPLVHYFNYAKGRLNALDREARKTDQIRQLVEGHNERLEKQAAAKAAAAAAAKAAAEAQSTIENRGEA